MNSPAADSSLALLGSSSFFKIFNRLWRTVFQRFCTAVSYGILLMKGFEHMNKWRRFTLAIGCTALLGISYSQAFAQEKLVIGTIGALNGPGSEWGRGVDGGTRIAASEINEAGGLVVGGKTYKIEVRSYDDGYKAADAVAAATRLIEQDGVKFIVGPLGSASALAIKPIVEDAHVLALVNSYTPETLAGNPKYLYRVLPTGAEFFKPLVAWVKKKHPEYGKVVIISPNNQTGWDSQKHQIAAYEAAGIKIVGKELFESSAVDFQPIVTRIMATSPDIIELDSTPPGTAGLIIRQARELGFKGRFVKGGGPGVEAIVQAAGKEFAEGAYTYVVADSRSEKYKWMEQQYAKIYNPPMNAFNVFFYDATNMLFAAMKKAGTVKDVDAIRKALTEIVPYQGVQGKLTWGGQAIYGNNHQLQVPAFVGTISDGKEKILDKLQTE